MSIKRKHSKKRINVKFVVVSLFAIYFLFTAFSQQFVINSCNEDIHSLKVNISKEQDKLAKLQAEEKLCSSDEYVEKAAREKLGLIRADETVFIDITGK